MKQRTMLQRTAPLLPASKPVYAGGSMAKISGDSEGIVTTAEENLQLAQPEAETVVEQVNLADL